MRNVARMTNAPAFGGGPRIPAFTVGDRLRKAREAARIPAGVMATDLDVDRSSITRYERATKVKRTIALAYAMRTQVPVEWLLTGETPSGGDGGSGSRLWESNPRPSHYKSHARHPFGVLVALDPAA